MGEAKIITAKIEVMCARTETDKYGPLSWQTLLAYTTTGMSIEGIPLPILSSNFHFLKTRSV
jgi:hypothetical protein